MIKKRFSLITISILVFVLGTSLFSQSYALGLPDFTELVEKNVGSVVNISTTQKNKSKFKKDPHGRMPETPFDDFLHRFFGEEGRNMPEFKNKSLGSGFILSSDGYILTNNHVIDNADEVIVKLTDRRELIAEVIGVDKRSDVALLKVEAENLPAVSIGQSSSLKVGEWVLAIGSPFGFDHSVTAGIVSAKGRNLPSENYVPFIQTDVAINPGNSGGPLYNLAGEVIGINSQIYSRTGGFMGLSFAIPIDVALNVVDQLKSAGHVTRGWLGILIQDVTRELAESFSMDMPSGALISRVLPDSPAKKAGLLVGDIIISFNGSNVVDSASLPPMVGISPVDKDADVVVIREGKKKTVKVHIAELPTEDDLEIAAKDSNKNVEIEKLNVWVSELTENQKNTIDNLEQGVYLESLKSGAGMSAGLRRGDIILKVNNQDVENIKQLKKIVIDLPIDKSVPVLVLRRNNPLFLALKIIED